MKQLIVVTAAALLAFACILPASAQQDQDEMMKLAQPGPPHALLGKLEGTWSLAMSSKFDPQATEYAKGSGKCSNTMILGGRFLKMEGTGTIMGMTAGNFTILGYDNRVNRYTLFGIDDFGTYSIEAEGDYDEASRTITFRGEETDGGMKMQYRITIQFVSDKKYIYAVYFALPDGNELKCVEVVSTKS